VCYKIYTYIFSFEHVLVRELLGKLERRLCHLLTFILNSGRSIVTLPFIFCDNLPVVSVDSADNKCTKHQFLHLLTATLKNSRIKNSKSHKRWYCPHHTDCVKHIWTYINKIFCVYFTHLPRSPLWRDLHKILHDGSTRRRSQPCQILSQSV